MELEEVRSYIYMNPVNYSDSELRKLRDDLLETYDELVELWAIELKEISSEKNFDPYTRRGEKKLEKLGKKHAEPLSDVELVLSYVQEELDKRENYYEQQRYIENGKYEKFDMDDAEFLQMEQEKTDRIRRILDGDEFNNF